MNKEVVIAVFIGIMIGIAGAVFLNRSSLFGKGNSFIPGSSVTEITALPSPGAVKKTTFSGYPADKTVVTNEMVSVDVKPVKNYPIAFQTLNDVTVKQEEKPYILKLKMKPGYNEIRATELGDRSTTVNATTLFYLPNTTIASRTAELESITAKNSTASADSELKDKLEKKVIELRYNAKKAEYGTVNEATTSIITLTTDQGKRSIAVEPDVTRYYQVSGYTVQEIQPSAIKKGDKATVFISTIGTDEKSYTVYREPSLQMLTGKIAQIDAQNFQITVVNVSKESAGYDVESSTTQQVWNEKTKTYDKIGFSKLSVGDALFGTYLPGTSARPLTFYVAVTR